MLKLPEMPGRNQLVVKIHEGSALVSVWSVHFPTLSIPLLHRCGLILQGATSSRSEGLLGSANEGHPIPNAIHRHPQHPKHIQPPNTYFITTDVLWPSKMHEPQLRPVHDPWLALQASGIAWSRQFLVACLVLQVPLVKLHHSSLQFLL